MKKLILLCLLFAGCAGTPLRDMKKDIVLERSSLRILVSHYASGQLSDEEFIDLIGRLELSEESDSLFECLYK
jgi:hypothetical protein